MSSTQKIGQILIAVWLMGILGHAQAPPAPAEEPPGPNPTLTVQKILDEAPESALDKDPPDALRTGDRALALAQATQDTVGIAQAQRLRARTLERLKRTEEAVAAWRAAVVAWEQANETPGRIEAWASAGLLLALEKKAGAEALVAQATGLGRSEAKRPLASADALYRFGGAYYQRGLLPLARSLFAVSLGIREDRIPNSLAVAASLNGLGLVADRQGDLAGAREYHQRALTIRQQRAPNSLDVAASWNNLGGVAAQQGDLTAAREYYQRALAIQQQRAPDSLGMATNWNNLGVVAGR